MTIRTLYDEKELAESRLLCYRAFKQNIDNCPSLEAAMDMFLHAPTSRMKKEWKNSMIAIDEQGTMFAHVSNAVFPINFDGATSLMCAIGDVASIQKGTTAIHDLMHAILSKRREEGVAFSYLFPFSGRYYARFGFGYCVMCKKWRLNLTQLEQPGQDVLIRLYEPDDANHAERIQKTCAQKYNLSMQRDSINWHTARDLSHLITKVAVSSENIPLGYLTYTTKDQENGSVKITDVAVSSPAALHALLISFLPQICSAHILLPDDIPLELMMAELNMQGSTCQYQNNGMVRIVALQEALMAMRHQGSGSLILDIDDPLLQENSGTWELSWVDGKTRTVRKTPNEEADMHFGIGELSRFVCAGISEEALQFYPTIPERLWPMVRDCFPEKPVAVFDYF